MPAMTPADGKATAGVSWEDASSLIIHTSSTIETKRSAFGRVSSRRAIGCTSGTTCRRQPATVENRDAWERSGTGVRQPRKLTVGLSESTSTPA